MIIKSNTATQSSLEVIYNYLEYLHPSQSIPNKSQAENREEQFIQHCIL
jgi:hypothetical protein